MVQAWEPVWLHFLAASSTFIPSVPISTFSVNIALPYSAWSILRTLCNSSCIYWLDSTARTGTTGTSRTSISDNTWSQKTSRSKHNRGLGCNTSYQINKRPKEQVAKHAFEVWGLQVRKPVNELDNPTCRWTLQGLRALLDRIGNSWCSLDISELCCNRRLHLAARDDGHHRVWILSIDRRWTMNAW